MQPVLIYPSYTVTLTDEVKNVLKNISPYDEVTMTIDNNDLCFIINKSNRKKKNICSNNIYGKTKSQKNKKKVTE